MRVRGTLSEDLYSSDSHFILELVQNADDNEYSPSVTPTLEISLDPGIDRLVVACNETGFKENQVKAICKIGASTKKYQAGYIGEKGIGFKSVFKVADKVFISSRPYRFSFDKHAELGMITPAWAEDCPGREGWTQFTLHLANTIDKAQLKLYLADVDPTLLIFLRKLRHLDIDLNNSSFVVQRLDLQSGLIRLHRHDRLTGVHVESQYLPVNRLIKTSSGEKKRPNIPETEVVLAFPLELDGSPNISPQAVHAFLPIRKYGFSFLIQGDFLTLANREDVLLDSLWNITIRDGLVSVFLEAIEEFRRRSQLALVWYRYIPIHLPTGFFSPFKDALLAKLRTMDILRSADGRLRSPSRLFVVKYKFDDTQMPLIEEQYFADYYLSADYDASDEYSPILYELGVRDFSDKELMDSLYSMGNAIRQQNASWHEAVCTVLLKLQRNWNYKQTIMKLPMVPLQDGSWVSLDSRNLFFSSEVIDIPRDLGLRLLCKLEPRSSRAWLFRELGVRDADPVAVSRKIMDVHRGSHASKTAVLSHAHFLFAHRAHRDQPGQYDLKQLYLLKDNGDLAKARDLYMNHEEPKIMPLSAIIPPHRFLHHSYLTPPPSTTSNSWYTWLRDVLCVNVVPRIVGGEASSEFLEFLTDLSPDSGHSDSDQILRALRDYWPRLRPQMSIAGVNALGYKISMICQDGTFSQLNATAVCREPLKKFSHLQFLCLDNPEDKYWNFLEELGVTMRPDGLLYLKWLRSLSGADSNEDKSIAFIYSQLEARFDENADAIRTAFYEEDLIFVPSPGGEARWVSRSNVRVAWNGPPSVVTKFVLKHCPNDILLQELIALTRSSSVVSHEDHKRVSYILKDISQIIAQSARDKTPNAPWISQLVAHRIFPVRLASTKELQLRRLDEKFYIPDKRRLFFEMFGSQVDMLELHEEVKSHAIQPLLDAIPQIGLHDLDKAVSRASSWSNELVQDIETQENYLMRVPLIERILRSTTYSSRQSKAKLLEKINKLVAFRMESISSTYTIEDLTHCHKEDLLINEESDRFVIRITSNCTPATQNIHFCTQLAVILGLKRDSLSMVICTDLTFAAQYLDEGGIGLQVGRDTQDADDSWASDMALREVETTASGWKTTRPKKIRASIFQDSDSIDGALPERAGVVAGLPTPAALIELNMQSISDAAALQSLSSIQVSNFDLSFTSIGIQNISTGVQNSSVTSTDHEAQSVATHNPHSMSGGSLSLVVGPNNQGFQGSNSSSGGFESVGRAFRTQATPYQYTNGILGELFIFETLRRILPNFTVENWTSELRGEVPEFSPFTSSSVADFRYSDTEGVLTSALFGDAKSLEWTNRWPEYHIEVKSTSDQEQAPFHLSARQLQLASHFTLPANEIPAAVYVLILIVVSIRED
ncbi:hypothetical protein B0H19DRAFT_1246120 [Mycena capillaripes]|nr:hypothetical protein B0H19DRAFT_1246120 [Mycena capillaripes]